MFLEDTAKVLWINGPPGCGKTILCASIIQRLRSPATSPRASSPPSATLAYFMYSSELQSRNHSLMIVRSWISQLVLSSEEAQNAALSYVPVNEAGTATSSELWELLAAIAKAVPQCAFIVDGLDECSVPHDERMQFLADLKKAVAHSLTRILVVSRDEVDIRSELQPLDRDQGVLSEPVSISELRVGADNVRGDIARFTQSIVNNRIPNKPEALRHALAGMIDDKSRGMFMWVILHEHQLSPRMNLEQLQMTVQALPSGLVRGYAQNWSEILQLQSHKRRRALAILRWALFAMRPLTVREIADALIVFDDDDCDARLRFGLPDVLDRHFVDDDIIGLCNGLVVSRVALPQPSAQSASDMSLATIHLSHHSVRGFLVTALFPRFPANVDGVPFHDNAANNNHLALLCLRYLQFQGSWENEDGALCPR